MKKKLNAKNLNKITLFFIIFILGLWWCLPTNAEALVLINNQLSGEQRFPGHTMLNDDGSTILLGTTNLGDAFGNLPGRWAVVMQATYPEGETAGDVIGFFAVGESEQDAVYGIIVGTTDPTGGNFSFVVTVVDGIGLYEGYTGFGTFIGNLIDAGELIEGNLKLFLNGTETKRIKRDRGNSGHGNPALLLLDE